MCGVLRLNYSVSSYSIVLFIQLFLLFTNAIFLFLCFLYSSFFLLDVFTSGVWASLNDLREPPFNVRPDFQVKVHSHCFESSRNSNQ